MSYDQPIANVTLLLAADSTDPPTEYEPPDGLLGANYSIPLLWLSLFSSAQIVFWPSTLDAAVSYAAATGHRDTCITRSRSRLEEWKRRWPETFNVLGPAWTDFIDARPEQFLAIWTEELAEMSASAEEWLGTFRSHLEALDEPDGPAFVEVLAQSYLEIDADGNRLAGTSEGPIGLLAGGYSWGVHAPWETS